MDEKIEKKTNLICATGSDQIANYSSVINLSLKVAIKIFRITIYYVYIQHYIKEVTYKPTESYNVNVQLHSALWSFILRCNSLLLTLLFWFTLTALITQAGSSFHQIRSKQITAQCLLSIKTDTVSNRVLNSQHLAGKEPNFSLRS